MATAGFGGLSALSGYTEGSVYTDGITIFGGAYAANGQRPRVIMGLEVWASGRGATRTITATLGGASFSMARASAGSAGGTGIQGTNHWLITGDTNARITISANGSFYFGRGGGGTTVGSYGNFAGTLGGNYVYADVPSAPKNLSAWPSPNVAGNIDFSFNGPDSDGGAAVTWYRVQYSNSPNFDGSDTGSLDVNVGNWYITGRTPGSTYWLRVAARNGVSDAAGTTSQWSNTVSMVATGLPSAPQNFSAVPSTDTVGRIVLTWSEPATTAGTITRYNVYRDGTFIGTSTYGAYWMDGIPVGMTNGYTVSARNAFSDANGTTGPATAQISAIAPGPPSAPQNLTAVASTTNVGQVALSWQAPATTTSAITGYTVYYSTGAVIGTTNDTTLTYTVNGLTPGTAYSFYVKARNAIADSTGTYSTQSNTVSAEAQGTPGIPGAFAIASSPAVANRLILTWTAATGSPTGYNVYTASGVLLQRLNSLKYVIDNLSAGVPAGFYVTARNASTDLTNSSGPATATAYGTPGTTTTQVKSPTEMRLLNETAASFNVTATLTAVTAYSFTYPVTAPDLENPERSAVPNRPATGFAVNNTNAQLSGVRTVTARSSTTVSYVKAATTSIASATVAGGSATNSTNTTLSGAYTVSATPSDIKVSYAKVAPNISARAATGIVRNTSNTEYNGTGLTITALSANTLSYAKAGPDLVETLAAGTATDDTNVTGYNGTYVVEEVPSYDSVTYSAIHGDSAETEVASDEATATRTNSKSVLNIRYRSGWAG